jgi:arginase
MPVVLGGDHAVEIGNLAGLTQRNNGTSPGVVYFDAHADINSPKTSPSGNVHGMDLHFAIQAGNLDPHRLIYVGMRHPDEGETKLLKKLGIRVITTDEINQHSPEHIAEIIHDTVGHEPHMSFDIDVISQKWVPGTGTPVPHGITPQQAYALVKAIKPGSFSMVEVDPERDHNGQTVEIANQVIKSATHGQRDITLISAPLNLGQPNPGTALGPEAMLKAGLPLLLQEQGHIITLNAVPVAAHQHPTPEHHVQSYFKGHRV